LSSFLAARLSPLAISKGEERTVNSREVSNDSVSELSDETLMTRSFGGDKEALALLFRRYARLVRSVAYKVLRDRFEADDLMQEVFLQLHQRCAVFDSSKGSARFWILQMTYHRAITRRRYLSCRHFYTQVDLEDVEPKLLDSRNDLERLEQWLDSNFRHSELQKLMAGLSDNQQKTLRLCFFEGYTLDEIAAELSQTRENVRHHYFRGLQKLRKQLLHNQNGR
jgi:RNA polymerase sigma-70 factor (ECF subfamily)